MKMFPSNTAQEANRKTELVAVLKSGARAVSLRRMGGTVYKNWFKNINPIIKVKADGKKARDKVKTIVSIIATKRMTHLKGTLFWMKARFHLYRSRRSTSQSVQSLRVYNAPHKTDTNNSPPNISRGLLMVISKK